MKRLIDLDEKPVLDLNNVAFQHITHGILVLGTWYMDRDTRTSEPCLVLLDAARRVARKRTIPCVVRLSNMWRWAPAPIGDPQFVSETIHDWLSSGALPGTAGNKADTFRVLDAVMSRLRDVVYMPPLPVKAAVKHGAVPVGDMTITERESGKPIHQVEVYSSHVRD